MIHLSSRGRPGSGPVVCTLALVFTSWVLVLPAQAGSANLSNLVVAGDSLSAGYQNSHLIERGQRAGFANVLATQAGLDLRLPLVAGEWGFPQVIQVPGPLPNLTSVQIVGVDPTAAPFIQSPYGPTRDVAVPGFTLQAFVGLQVPCNPPLAIDPLYPINWMASQIVNPKCDATGITQLAAAAARRPSTAIMWIGSNDVLFPILFGGDPTKPADFAKMYALAISTMARSSGKLVVATIPDVTLLPYLTSIPALVAILGQQDPPLPVPPELVPGLLGLQPGDKITPYAFPLIQQALANHQPLPATIPDPTSPTGSVPVVIRAKRLTAIRQAVITYNAVIWSAALLSGSTVVDIYSLVNNLSANGVTANGTHLTTNFGGGLFSFDGVHPSDTGYAIIANKFISTMNSRLGTHIPSVSIDAVAANDPFVPQSVAPSYVSAGMAASLRSLFAH
jgi:hypothetical protein